MNKSGRWAFMRRMVLRRSDGDVYMRRLRIVQTPWFAVYLHRFDAPDPGVDLHDHPWWFGSLVLRGGYIEQRFDARDACAQAEAAERIDRVWRLAVPAARGESVVRGRWSWRSMPLTECHTIRELLRVPTWTLVVCGPRRRSWGFYEPSGWVPSQSYASERRAVFVEGAVSS